MPLPRTFYEEDAIVVAKSLLGKLFVHESESGVTAGKVVETEAYRGPEDKAAHSFGGRRTARNEVMFGEKGRAYVYFIYGLYWCFNVTAGNVIGKPEAVLIRALEPVAGLELMVKRRGDSSTKNSSLTNGPSKLCMAMGISKSQNKADVTIPPLYFEKAAPISEEDIVTTKRIGVEYAAEWKDRLWRFYIKGNKFTSAK